MSRRYSFPQDAYTALALISLRMDRETGHSKSDSRVRTKAGGPCMTKMVQIVEEMRARLSQIADSEQALVRALGEALSLVDQKLLQDVRSLTTDHEARRAAILYELQGLASRIGAFPTAQSEPAPGLDYVDPTVVAIGTAHPGIA